MKTTEQYEADAEQREAVVETLDLRIRDLNKELAALRAERDGLIAKLKAAYDRQTAEDREKERDKERDDLRAALEQSQQRLVAIESALPVAEWSLDQATEDVVRVIVQERDALRADLYATADRNVELERKRVSLEAEVDVLSSKLRGGGGSIREQERNAPKLAPARAAADEHMRRVLALNIPDVQKRNIKAMEPSLRVAFESGWHAALNHFGLKR